MRKKKKNSGGKINTNLEMNKNLRINDKDKKEILRMKSLNDV